MSAVFGAWLRRERERRGWSRRELALRIAGAAGSAVTAPVPALESYISRWEAGNVAISARYRQLLSAVLGSAGEASAPQPPSGPAADPRKWMRAMHALASDIADGTFRPGGKLSARAVLAHRYGLPADAVMRAQDELLSTAVLSRGQTYGTLYVARTAGRQASRAPLPAAPGPADPGRHPTAIPPVRARGSITCDGASCRTQPASVCPAGRLGACGARRDRDRTRIPEQIHKIVTKSGRQPTRGYLTHQRSGPLPRRVGNWRASRPLTRGRATASPPAWPCAYASVLCARPDGLAGLIAECSGACMYD